MRSTVVISFVGLCLSVGAMLAGCGDDVTVSEASEGRKGEEGDSCVKTDDCEDGLSCIQNFCTESAPVGEGGNGPGPVGVVLSDEGESCTRSADCKSDLICVQQTCVADAGGGEGGAPTAKLGARGESCEAPDDCGEGLSCFPNGLTGICDYTDFGLTTTGKTCGLGGGSTNECAEAGDCCQLPNTYVSQYGNCEDIEENFLGADAAGNCAGTPAAAFSFYCFVYKSYCDCAASAWACTANKCVYNGACDVDGDDWRGCPSLNRAGLATNATTCGDNGKCGAAVATACDATPDCAGLAAFDLGTTCSDGECVCYQHNCYVKCEENLDCAVGFVCDTAKTKLCVPADSCTTDEQCATRLVDSRATCEDGICTRPCTIDRDCGPSGGLAGAFNGTICVEGTCQAVGCSDNDDCPTSPSGNLEKMFCAEPAAAPGGAIVHSAVND